MWSALSGQEAAILFRPRALENRFLLLRQLAKIFRRLVVIACKVHQSVDDVARNLPEIEVNLVDDSEIARIHVEFMNVQGPTDVITFDHGEIFVSTETAEAQRQSHGNSLHREVALYIVHGLMHLAGYDDRSQEAFRQMADQQESVLRRAWPA